MLMKAYRSNPVSLKDIDDYDTYNEVAYLASTAYLRWKDRVPEDRYTRDGHAKFRESLDRQAAVRREAHRKASKVAATRPEPVPRISAEEGTKLLVLQVGDRLASSYWSRTYRVAATGFDGLWLQMEGPKRLGRANCMKSLPEDVRKVTE